MSDILLPGDAGFADVLAGKKFTSKNGYNVTGAMPENGAIIITPGPNAQAIPAGHHNGAGSVPGVTVPAANVLAGTTIAGTPGTMPDRQGVINATGTAQWGDGALAVYLPAGHYGPNSPGNSEIQVSVAQLQAADADLVSANIRAGVSIFQVAGSSSVVDTSDATLDTGANQLLAGYTAYARGTKYNGGMPNRGAPTFAPGTAAQGIAAGYYSGGQVNGDANLLAQNILTGISIFGVAGNVTKLTYAHGTNTAGAGAVSYNLSSGGNVTYYPLTVSGLSFTPNLIVCYNPSSTDSEPGIVLYDGTGKSIFNNGYIQIRSKSTSINFQFIYMNQASAYVNGSGFNIPVYISGASFTWLALYIP